MDDEVNSRRRRRTHSPAFRAQVLEACRHSGVSIAAVALANGLNANLVRRWLNEVDARGVAASIQRTQVGASSSPAGGVKFVPVQLADRPAEAAAIRLELRRGPVAVSVSWPAQEAAACGAWLREWLR
jgi:transposase